MQLGKTGFIQLHLFQRCIDNSGIGVGGYPFFDIASISEKWAFAGYKPTQ